MVAEIVIWALFAVKQFVKEKRASRYEKESRAQLRKSEGRFSNNSRSKQKIKGKRAGMSRDKGRQSTFQTRESLSKDEEIQLVNQKERNVCGYRVGRV